MSNFTNQSNLAKAKTFAYRKNYEWSTRNGRPGYSVGSSYSDYLLRKGFDDAYASPEGYSIKVNPITGKKEMFVRGTARKGEWIQNALEAIPRKAYGFIPVGGASGVSMKIRREYAKKLDAVAEKEGVSVVYGHSRGAAVVSDMKHPSEKVGVDGAMLLARRGKRDFVNYRQAQVFDKLIGIGEKKKIVKKATWKPWSKKYHKVYYN